MFRFPCPCGAELVHELQWGYEHDVLCPRCFKSFTITFLRNEE